MVLNVEEIGRFVILMRVNFEIMLPFWKGAANLAFRFLPFPNQFLIHYFVTAKIQIRILCDHNIRLPKSAVKKNDEQFLVMNKPFATWIIFF